MKNRIGLLLMLLAIPFLLIACNGDETASTDTEEPDAAEEAESEATENGDFAEEELERFENLAAKFDPLGEMPIPEDNPMTEEKIELGKTLYFDPRLSGDNSLSCASCHAPQLGWSDGRELFIGFGGEEGPRHSPTIINSGYYTSYFWDGRADSLEEQAAGPITSPIEMNQDLDELVEELKEIDGYVERFDEAFEDGITADNILKAIAAFERTIVIDDTPFDRFLAGEYDAMTEQEIRGMEVFAGEGNCISCHNGPNLSDNNFYNIGISGDDGRMEITGNPADEGAFRTPGLYGIAHHAPYMHDGSLATLEEVIDYYDRGGDDHPNKSPKMQPLNLSEEDKEALLAFLLVLSGDEPPTVEVPELPE